MNRASCSLSRAHPSPQQEQVNSASRCLHRRFVPWTRTDHTLSATATMPGDTLMTWWAVLHTLSMLARYEPSQWSRHINVDVSQQAVPLESLLEKAVSALPTLIAYTLDEVYGGELTRR